MMNSYIAVQIVLSQLLQIRKNYWILTQQGMYRPPLPNQEMNGEQSPVCLLVYGIKRMKLEWKRSSQLSKQPWLGIEPWALRLTGRNALFNQASWRAGHCEFIVISDGGYEMNYIFELWIKKNDPGSWKKNLSGRKRTWKNPGLTYLWLNLSTHLSLDQIVTTWDSLFPSPIGPWLLMIKAGI